MLHGAGIRYQHLPANLSTCHRFVGKQKPAPFVRIWEQVMGFFQQQTMAHVMGNRSHKLFLAVEIMKK